MGSWFRSTSLRLSFAFSALIIVAFLVAGALIWRSVGDAGEAQLREQIELEVAAIEQEMVVEGPDAAVAAIESRTERPGALEYWLTDPQGRHLVGDVRALDGPNGWRRIEIAGSKAGREGAGDILVLTKSLTSGYRISVGEDLSRSAAIQAAILQSIAGVGAVALLTCLLTGAFISRKMLGKIDRLIVTVDKVAAGDLAARYAVQHTSTDIDDIGAGVNTMLDRIETLIDNVRRVSRDVAHDLRTPLSHLRQRLEAIATARTYEERSTAIEDAHATVDDIVRMFDATLRLAEIDSGAAANRFRQVDLGALATKVIDAYRPDVEASGRRLSASRIDAAIIDGDDALLEQALANLVENAMRHTPEGTLIDVSVIRDKLSVSLYVRDNGPGIAENMRSRVLQPFARLDENRSTAGAGLGLSIVAAITRTHCAELTLSDATPGLSVALSWADQGQNDCPNVVR